MTSEQHSHGHTDIACAWAHGELPAPTGDRRLVAVFASPVAAQLVHLAAHVGYDVVVLDPDPARAIEGVQLVRGVADLGMSESTDVVVTDHDRPELGDVLAAVLGLPTRWVGVMGSPRHTAPHLAALRSLGLPDAEIARVHRPIGLDIGSRSPAEIAVATVAGLLADRNGRSGGPYGASCAVQTSPGLRIRTVDAFTDRAFAGNPAAVCLLDGDTWPDYSWMRQVAAEMNLSETAFVLPLPAGADADFALRWFTPTLEVELCGHATLATAHTLHVDRGGAGTVRFSSRSGVLIAHSRDDGTITLDFPMAPVLEVAQPPGLAAALGGRPLAAYSTGALRDLLLVFTDEDAVRTLAPDVAALARLTTDEGVRGFICTAPASAVGRGYDFVSRFFAPGEGIPEDPVTGSAHTALAPYWAERLGRDRLTGLQASARTGLVRTELHGDRVHLTGHAVTIVDGTLLHVGS